MTSCVRILSTASVDSSPSILLVATDGSKVLVNCGEGCQRAFIEYGQRLSTVSTICLCSLHHSMVGGLPGAILTTADVVATSATNASLLQQLKNDKEQRGSTDVVEKRQNDGAASESSRAALASSSVNEESPAPGEPLPPQLEVVGPIGTKHFVHALRHFMRREQFRIKIHEGTIDEPIPARTGRQSNKKMQNGSNRKSKAQNNPTCQNDVHVISMAQDRQQQTVGFTIQSLAFAERIEDSSISISKKRPYSDPLASSTDNPSDDVPLFPKQCISFIMRMPSTPGKFLKDKAVAFGVPKGPLYAKLKSGLDVTFTDPSTGQVKQVQSVDVVEPMLPGVVVMILYYPSSDVALQLFSSEVLQNSSTPSASEAETNSYPEIVIHISTKRLFDKYGICHWQGESKTIEHVFLSSSVGESEFSIDDGTPFRSADQGAYARSLLCPHIYHFPQRVAPSPLLASGFRYGKTSMEYTLLPRSKRGMSCGGDLPNDYAESTMLVESTGALTLASQILKESATLLPNIGKSKRASSTAELIFAGTASAMPCKHRNVTGMLLKQADGRSILLDVGEGTIGQLLRMHPSQYQTEIYNEIRAVWISHPHADHHLGLLRVLKDRPSAEPLLLIAPTPVFRFLNEYATIDRQIQGKYIPIDCKNLINDDPQLQRKIQTALGISKCRAIPVTHCAHAYAVILEGTSFGTVVYSGDCRPSSQLALAAKGADILIHEATFEGGMEAEAVYKKHSTVDEALNIGRLMECKCVVLTHFSQRYPKIPPIPIQFGNDTFPIIFAFDFMKLHLHTLFLASALTPALRLLFPEDNTDDNIDAAEPTSTDILSIPGVFADVRLL
jgi:ribonuclease Z